jgi:hypothetical protein
VSGSPDPGQLIVGALLCLAWAYVAVRQRVSKGRL